MSGEGMGQLFPCLTCPEAPALGIPHCEDTDRIEARDHIIHRVEFTFGSFLPVEGWMEQDISGWY